MGIIFTVYQLDVAKTLRDQRWSFVRQCLVLVQTKAQMTMVPALWVKYDDQEDDPEEETKENKTLEYHGSSVFQENDGEEIIVSTKEAKEEDGEEDELENREENEREALAEGEGAITEETEELPAEAWVRARTISAEILADYQETVRQFYLIDPTTYADASLINANRFLEKDVHVDKAAAGPQILIYHTHSQEAFADSKKGDPSETVVGVGKELARILREEYGYDVLHHDGVYDLPSRNGAYSKALPEIRKLLQENPSIQVVIDLHRDEMPENLRQVTQIDGKQTAKCMFFNGLSRTSKTGKLDYLKNDHLEDNLAFSFQMEKAAQEFYPGFTRKIYLKGYRYNMHLCPKTLLIELGAQNNTVEEAMNACIPLARLLDYVLSGKACEHMDNL